MKVANLIKKIAAFESGGTEQNWRMDSNFDYENDYIKVIRIDSSNKAGGKTVKRGKQWSIIVEEKKDFTSLKNWKELVLEFGGRLTVTPVRTGINKGKTGIRFYDMSNNPSNEIVKEILDVIFD